LIIPPSFPSGAALTPALASGPTTVGALAGICAVASGQGEQREEHAGSDAGTVIEHGHVTPPIQAYGPDGKPVGDSGRAEAEEDGDIEGSESSGNEELSLE